MTTKAVTLRSVVMAASVDRESGVIRNVPVITKGATLPSGGGQGSFDVDDISLTQVADAINKSGRVRSRITHPEVEGVDGITRRAGYFSNATVRQGKVYADFQFGSYATADMRTILCGLVEEEPRDVGVSIVSETGTIEPSTLAHTGMVLRVSQIDAIDWTDKPAANPAGMLSATKGIKLMEYTPEQLAILKELGLPEGADADAIAAFVAGLTDEQKQKIEGGSAVVTAEGEGGEVEKFVATLSPEQAEMLANLDEEKKPVAASAKADKKAIAEAVMLAQKNERARVREIQAIALKVGRDDKWSAKHIDDGTEVGEVRRIALNTLQREPKDMATSQVKVGADLNRDTLNDAVRDAVLLRAGASRVVKIDGDGKVMLSASGKPDMHKHHDRAADFRGRSLIEMGRRYLVALGYRQADNLTPVALAGILLSRSKLRDVLPSGVFLAGATGDFPFLLADAMGKVLRSEYVMQPHTWEMWCGKRNVPDFKDIKVLQLGEMSDLAVIPEGAQYEFTQLIESKEVYAVETQGRGLKFTRQMLINDDLSAFDRVPKKMGQAAMRAVEAKAISILTVNANLADGGALFNNTPVTTAGGHANVTTGALTAAAAVASIDAAMRAMRVQKALGSDDPLEIQPKIALVPTTQYFKAKVAFASGVDPSLANQTPNPIASEGVTVIQSARLDADSAAEWYLLADPNAYDTVEVAFLEGEETPVIEEETDFNTDSLHMKVRHTFGAKAIDWRGMVRGSGA